ncbi:MAG TPA: Ig-like domain-containing protein [Gemmatimonadaceae bacterium]
MRKLYRSLLATGAILGIAACGDDVSIQEPTPPPAAAITGITVSPATATIDDGQTTQISASVQTNGGEGVENLDLTVTWSSSNANVATVGPSTGLVTGVDPGNAVITARSNGNQAYSAGSSVTVNAPTVLPNAILSFTVNPTAASVQAGNQVAVSTNFTASPGATVTFANTYNNANCTGPADGANPTVTAVTVGTCVVTITASGSGTGLISNQMQASVAITITTLGPALQSLTVNPTAWNAVPGATQVVTTTHQAAAGATVTYANSSSDEAVATVTSSGPNPTITAVGNGSAQITIMASGSGDNLQPNSLTAFVTVNIQAASVSISSLTTTCLGGIPAGCVAGPVNLAATGGQIEATLNIESGNQQIASVAVFLGQPDLSGSCTSAAVVYTEAARQIFGVNGAPSAPITLSINTAEFDANFVPKWLNGLECIQAQLFPVAGPNPDASNTIKFTLTNADVVYFDATLGTTGGDPGLNHTGTSAVQAAGAPNVWWQGGFTFRPHPVLYSGAANVASITYTSTMCGAVAAVAAPWAATFPCTGVEATQNIANTVAIAYVPAYTLTASPTTFMTAATAGFVPGNPVWALVPTNEDNVGPTTAVPVFVAPGASGWHGDGSAGVLLATAAVGGSAAQPPTSYTVNATDAGVGGGVPGAGLTAPPTITELTIPVTFASGATPAGIPLPETLVPSPYVLRGDATSDILNNLGTASANTSVFGVDLVVLDAQYGDRANSASAGVVWQGLDTQIYAANAVTGGVSPGTGASGLAVSDWDGAGPDGGAENILIDAIDSRSGLDNATALTQKIQRANAGGTANCLAFSTFAMTTILVDNYVQSAGQQMDCALAAGVRVGEYTWYGYVSDRAGNARLANSAGSPPLAGSIAALRMAIDEALPNITGIGFQTGLYAGGQPATYSFSANDDLELWQGQVTLAYGPTPGQAPVTYPYGAQAYSTPAFGTPFDGAFANVLNGQDLTINYYIDVYDFASAAAFVPGPPATPPSGNVMTGAGAAAYTSGVVNSGVTANIRDVAAQQAAVPLVAPVLVTQLSLRAAAPAYHTSMIDWRIIAHSGTHSITAQDAAASSVGLSFCDRVDIYEVVEGGVDVIAAGMLANDPLIGNDAGDALVWRSTVTTTPVPGAIPDNGFQRFLTYISAAHTSVGTGLFTAACIKTGSALLSPIG